MKVHLNGKNQVPIDIWSSDDRCNVIATLRSPTNLNAAVTDAAAAAAAAVAVTVAAVVAVAADGAAQDGRVPVTRDVVIHATSLQHFDRQ